MTARGVKVYADPALWIFALIALACLVVSAPATFNLVALFHNDRTPLGVAATVALLVVLEAGTVAAKLATLQPGTPAGLLGWFFRFGLAVNALSNFVHGLKVGAAWGLEGLLLWGGSLVYAASVSAIVFFMLYLICERVRYLTSRPPADVEAQVARAMEPVRLAVASYRALMGEVAQLEPPPALPAPREVYARPAAAPAAPGAVRVYECPRCGSEISQQQYGASQRHGDRWKGCDACRVRP